MGQVLDIARGAYAKLPYATRARVAKVLRHVPARYRFGATHRRWRARIEAARQDPVLVVAHRDEARRALLTQVLAHSPYYRDLLRRTFGPAVSVEALLEPAQWARIPVLSPDIVVDEARRLCTVPASRLDRGSTGGTSGRPVQFFLDRDRSPVEYAFVFDAWARSGFTPDEWRAVLRGVEVGGEGARLVEADPALRELRLSVFHLTDEAMALYWREITARGIVYLHGYPSAIAMFASYLLRNGLAPAPQIRGVMLMAERLYPLYRDAIHQAFPAATLVPFFGLSEKCAFATEVADIPDTYDFEPLYGYTELLDATGHTVTEPGRRGRIVSTGLLFRGMPFLRYDTRDEATLVALPSARNGYRLRVSEIAPRRGHEFLVSRAGSLIPIIGPLVFGTEMLGIREFQFYQDTPGEAEFRVVLDPGHPPPDVERFIGLINRKGEGQLVVRAAFVEAIPVSPRGKRRFIDQRVDIAAIEAGMNLAADGVSQI